MKHIKLYESFTLKIKSYYIIYGNLEKVISVLNAIKNNWTRQSKNEVYHLDKIINKIKLRIELDSQVGYTNNCIGIFLYFSWDGFSYTLIANYKHKEDLLNNKMINNIYEFQGEIKSENGKMVYDPTEKIARKYNL